MIFFKRYAFILFWLLLASVNAYSTHIIGGEITYRCLGNNIYEINLKIYRDCYNGRAPFDDPAYVLVFDSASNLLQTKPIDIYESRLLPLVSVDACRDLPEGVCVEEAIYTDTILLPPIKGGYQLSYQRCCRNHTIQNIEKPGETGATYYTKVLDTTIVKCNSTPAFKNFPPIFICQNLPINFDHSAVDPDGDSLSYELCTPYLGADTSYPAYSPIEKFYNPPPFDTITWLAPYNKNNPLGGVPLQINSSSGLLTGTPNVIGQFVVGICVKEYRKGILLTENKRDFQFNVTDCPPRSRAALPAKIKACGFKAKFVNQSTRAEKYFWNFGDPNTLADTSTEFSPTYTYPAIGKYIVTLITDRHLLCSDTAQAEVTVYNTLKGANFGLNNICFNDSARFIDQSILSEGSPSQWQWEFGDGSIADTKDPVHKYSAPGTYNVFLTVYNEIGCTDTITKKIIVYPMPDADAGKDTVVDKGTIVTLTPSGGTKYIWQNAPGLSCTQCKNPQATVLEDMTYYVTVENSFGCQSIDSVTITLCKIVADVSTDSTVCFGEKITLTATGGLKYTWSPMSDLTCVDPICSSVELTATQSSKYIVTAEDQYFCKSKDSVNITVILFTTDAGPDQTICPRDTTTLNATGGINFLWKPANDVSCINCQTTQVHPSTASYYSVLAEDIYGCKDEDSVRIDVFPFLPKVSGDTIICNGEITILKASGGIKYTWKPSGDVKCINATCSDISVSPTQNKDYYIRIDGNFSCKYIDTVTVRVRPLIIPEVDFTFKAPRCYPEPVIFKGLINNFDFICLKKIKWLWNFGDGSVKDTSQNPIHQYTKDGVFTVSLSVNGFPPMSKTLSLLPIDSCRKNIFIPNVFSPNNDNNNDSLYVRGIGLTKLVFRVYNRWGELIFRTENMNIGWDGTYKGQKLTPQVFEFIAEGTYYDNTPVVKKGNITLIE